MRIKYGIETASPETIDQRRESGGKRSYLSAHAVTEDVGTTITYRNNGGMEEVEVGTRERERMFEDYDPTPSVSSWENERSAIANHRASIDQLTRPAERPAKPVEPQTSTRNTIKTKRGELVRERTIEELESTFEITVGLGVVALEAVASMVARDSVGYGFRVSQAIGYWRGEQEDCATITFQGPRPIAMAILHSLAKTLPEEKFAHVTESTPATRYIELKIFRETSRTSGGIGS